MKKTGIISAIIIIIVAAGYFFLRFYLLRAKDFKPDTSKARSIIDLRPALIARLQQMVKDGSKGLYKLSIESIEPDIAGSSVDLNITGLVVDSAALQKLDSMHMAPDETYSVSLKKLHIEGISIPELVSGKSISLDKITIRNPVVTVYRKERQYNAAKRVHKDSMTLYQRLASHVKNISVTTILIDHGIFINKNLLQKNKDNRLERVSIQMNDLLIDSTTQFDTHRFFFARTAHISCGRIQKRTADSLYFFTVDSLSIEASANKMTAYNLALTPRANKKAFQKKLTHRNDRFDLAIPRVVLQNMNWWALFNRQSLDCGIIDTYKGSLHDFVNTSLPPKPLKVANFPYQILRKLSMPVHIKKIKMHHVRFSYEEYNAASGRSGILYFDDVNAELTNIINISQHIRPGMRCTVDATAFFMHKIPIKVRFGFGMKNYQNGEFTSDFHLAEAEGMLINPITEPLGFFSVKSGTVHDLSAQITGNNAYADAKLTMLYDDLHITSLKKERQEKGNVNKKRILGFIANTFFIKNSNSNKKDGARSPEVRVDRGNSGFFNFVWRAIRLAILKTVGIPENFAPK